jgi:hypothetical protein
MPKSYYDVVNAEPSLASYWRLGAQRTPPPFAPPTPGGGGEGATGPLSAVSEYDGFIYSDNVLRNSWVSSPINATVNLNEPNDDADNRANLKAVRTHAFSYYTSAGFGKARFTKTAGENLEPYRFLLFAVRSWVANVSINVYLEDAAGARIGGVKTMTVFNRQFGFGGLRWCVVRLVDDLQFVAGSMPTAYAVVIEDNSASARASTNKVYISELHFARKEGRYTPNHTLSFAETIPYDESKFYYATNDAWNWRPPYIKPAQNPYRAGGSKFNQGANLFADYWDNITGDARGTTREIAQWATRKWGFAQGTVDPVRGNGPPALVVGGIQQIQGNKNAETLGLFFDELPESFGVNESGWKNWTFGDYERRTGVNGINGYWLQSAGYSQIKQDLFPPERIPFLSTAYNLDFIMALIRAYMNNDMQIGGAQGSIRKALDMYYSGSLTPTGNGYSVRILGGTSDGTGDPIDTGLNFNGLINDRPWISGVNPDGNPFPVPSNNFSFGVA